MNITVIGTGYLGATHAACMAELGHNVLGVDVDKEKIEALTSGNIPFFEPGLQEIVERNLAEGRLRFTTDYAEAAEFAQVHFLAVGTPQQRESYAADVRYVDAVIDELVPLLHGNHVIFGKSTVPVGTAARLQERADACAPADASVEIAWNPEFLREGHAVADTLTPNRIVVGTRPGSTAASTARKIYGVPEVAEILRENSVGSQSEVHGGALPDNTGEPASSSAEIAARSEKIAAVTEETAGVCAAHGNASIPFIETDLATAELVKVSANAFLATKISFINAISEGCEAVGADVTTLAEALGYDDRIGHKFLGAGLGFGGGCLPKDIRAFMARAGELGVDQALTFLREVDTVNMRRRDRVVEMAKAACGGSVLGAHITVLGAAFKPNSDDVRDSPALAVAGTLSLAGAATAVYDPKAMGNARKVFPTLSYAENIEEALSGAELVILATEWSEFRELDPAWAGRLVARQRIIDGRNVLPPEKWKAAGWDLKALGRGNV